MLRVVLHSLLSQTLSLKAVAILSSAQSLYEKSGTARGLSLCISDKRPVMQSVSMNGMKLNGQNCS